MVLVGWAGSTRLDGGVGWVHGGGWLWGLGPRGLVGGTGTTGDGQLWWLHCPARVCWAGELACGLFFFGAGSRSVRKN